MFRSFADTRCRRCACGTGLPWGEVKNRHHRRPEGNIGHEKVDSVEDIDTAHCKLQRKPHAPPAAPAGRSVAHKDTHVRQSFPLRRRADRGLIRKQVKFITRKGAGKAAGQLDKIPPQTASCQRERSGIECDSHGEKRRRIQPLFRGKGTLLAPVSATSLLARSSDSIVPASVHQPSSIEKVIVPSSI